MERVYTAAFYEEVWIDYRFHYYRGALHNCSCRKREPHAVGFRTGMFWFLGTDLLVERLRAYDYNKPYRMGHRRFYCLSIS